MVAILLAGFGLYASKDLKIGDLDQVSHPGADWFESSKVWTWARFRETYKYMKLAKLAVDEVEWVAKGS